MRRADALLFLVVVAIFALLMAFAGQPVTPEAALVQQWYDALCNPDADQSPLWRLTWRGDLTEDQLKDAIARYRANHGLPSPCRPVVDVNVIYFQWIPPELADSIERIKFVAVNVYGEGRPTERNLIGSQQTGVHVLFGKSGDVFILPRFLAQSPLGVYTSEQKVPLYNNDGTRMGQAEVTGAALRLERDSELRLGIPVRLEAERSWGRYEVHIFVDGIEIVPEFYSDALPPEEQDRFLKPAQDDVSTGTVLEGVIWLLANESINNLHVGFEVFQTPWDMRPLTALVAVEVPT